MQTSLYQRGTAELLRTKTPDLLGFNINVSIGEHCVLVSGDAMKDLYSLAVALHER